MRAILGRLLAAALALAAPSACVPIAEDELPVDPLLVDADSDGVSPEGGDCDDGDAEIHPDAPERCNGSDDDCNGVADDGLDEDEDTYSSCDSAAGFLDCDDANPEAFPGHAEVCDGEDNNCNGDTDERLDLDADGFSGCDFAEAVDCDDDDTSVYPGAPELCDDKDNDCDRITDDGFDQDGDGVVSCAVGGAAADCDDDDVKVYPGRTESCDAQDNDCDEAIDEGFDGDDDGYYQCASAEPDGTPLARDCADEDPDISPGADELCNGQDDDCDGDADDEDPDVVDPQIWYADEDEDGYGDPLSSTAACVAPDSTALDDSDCDDTDGEVNPDTLWYADADRDGWGTGAATAQCQRPGAAFAVRDGDCADSDATVHPEAPELCNDRDDDCDEQRDDGIIGRDADGDGYVLCQAGGLTVDCDDADLAIYPGAAERCDGADGDCNGTVDEGFDGDGDGFAGCETSPGETDCDDTAVAINPDATEVCDGKDTDCSGGGADYYIAKNTAIPADYRSIQAAIDAQASGCSLAVAAGAYYERIDFKGKAITLRSEDGPEATIIDGDKGPDSPGITVRFGTSEGAGAVLEGFTVTGDNGYTPENENIVNGGCVYFGAGVSAIVRGSILTGNTADRGPAVYCEGCAGALLEASTVSRNVAYRATSVVSYLILGEGGAVYALSGALESRGNRYLENDAGRYGGAVYVEGGSFHSRGDTFEANTAVQGGGIASFDADVTVDDATFVRNSVEGLDETLRSTELANGRGGALLTSGGSIDLKTSRLEANEARGGIQGAGSGGAWRIEEAQAEVLQSVFEANVAGNGGGAIYVDTSTFLFRNNLFAHNTATIGGAVLVEYSDGMSILNNTFVDNDTTLDTGTLYVTATNGPIVGNIIAFDATSASFYYEATSVNGTTLVFDPTQVQYNDLFGSVGGTVAGDSRAADVVGVRGNLSSDPKLVDRAGGDYRLAEGSPCIDAGQTGAQMNDTDGTRNDMGMYGGPLGAWEPDDVGAPLP